MREKNTSCLYACLLSLLLFVRLYIEVNLHIHIRQSAWTQTVIVYLALFQIFSFVSAIV